MLLAAMMASCCAPQWDARQEYLDTITQVGLPVDVKEGSAGFMEVSGLSRYGNHGLLQGEGAGGYVMYDGIINACTGGERVNPTESFVVQAGLVTWFQADRIFEVDAGGREQLERVMDLKRATGAPEALHIEGVFESISVKTITSGGWSCNDQGDEDSIAGSTQVLTNVVGTMNGYYFPSDLEYFHPSGYHLHFIDAAGGAGGHVEDYSLIRARIYTDISSRVQTLMDGNRPVDEFNTPFKPFRRP